LRPAQLGEWGFCAIVIAAVAVGALNGDTSKLNVTTFVVVLSGKATTHVEEVQPAIGAPFNVHT